MIKTNKSTVNRDIPSKLINVASEALSILTTNVINANIRLGQWSNIYKATPGFIHCSFKVASLATLNKQMISSLATFDALSLVNHKAQLHLVWVHMVDICTALINSW